MLIQLVRLISALLVYLPPFFSLSQIGGCLLTTTEVNIIFQLWTHCLAWIVQLANSDMFWSDERVIFFGEIHSQ